MKHKLVAATMTALGAVGLLAATTNPAAAGGTYQTPSYVKATYPGIQVTAVEAGDRITICDTAANNFAAWMTVQYQSGEHLYRKTITAGTGHCWTASASNGHNIRENRWVAVIYRGTAAEGQKVFSFYNNH